MRYLSLFLALLVACGGNPNGPTGPDTVTVRVAYDLLTCTFPRPPSTVCQGTKDGGYLHTIPDGSPTVSGTIHAEGTMQPPDDAATAIRLRIRSVIGWKGTVTVSTEGMQVQRGVPAHGPDDPILHQWTVTESHPDSRRDVGGEVLSLLVFMHHGWDVKDTTGIEWVEIDFLVP